jgi:hypothetical protein
MLYMTFPNKIPGLKYEWLPNWRQNLVKIRTFCDPLTISHLLLSISVHKCKYLRNTIL